MIDSFAKVYTPIVVVLALFMCTIPWAFGTDVGILWVPNGLVTIVIACPCALIISTPVTYVAGLAAVTQKGIVCKGGQHLEGMGRVKSIYFDKTGLKSQSPREDLLGCIKSLMMHVYFSTLVGYGYCIGMAHCLDMIHNCIILFILRR
jgi:hypothetical protein